MAVGLGHLRSAAAALVAALAFVAALDELPSSVRAVDHQIEANAGLSPLEKELVATRSFGLDPTLILRAAELLPPDAVFHVATGPGILSGHDAAAPFAAYWLLPRRHTPDPMEADWILSFGAETSKLGVAVEVVDDIGAAGQLLRVRR